MKCVVLQIDFEVIADEAVTSTDALLSASSVMAEHAERVSLYFKEDALSGNSIVNAARLNLGVTGRGTCCRCERVASGDAAE